MKEKNEAYYVTIETLASPPMNLEKCKKLMRKMNADKSTHGILHLRNDGITGMRPS